MKLLFVELGLLYFVHFAAYIGLLKMNEREKKVNGFGYEEKKTNDFNSLIQITYLSSAAILLVCIPRMKNEIKNTT